jgi:hypothetical protein
MGFADTIGKTEVPEAPDDRHYDGPPRIRWNNGAESKHDSVPDVPGTFYVSEKTLNGFVPQAPWHEVNRYENEVGYEAEELDIVFIAHKGQPFKDVRDAKGKWVKREWFKVWEQGMSIQTEYLAYVEGFYDPQEPQYGTPALFVTKGMVGKRVGEILTRYREDLLAEATRVANTGKKDKVKLPGWSFRLRLGPERTKKGFVFTETGFGSKVQLPMLLMPQDITDALMDELYVGETLLQHGRIVYDSFEDWRTTIYTNGEAEQEEEGSAAQQGTTSSQRAARVASPSRTAADARPTVPERVVFTKNEAGEVLDIEAELERVKDEELTGIRPTFSKRRDEALRKLEWDTETREHYEEQILGKPFTFSKLSTREQYHVVLQLEQYARGEEVPF